MQHCEYNIIMNNSFFQFNYYCSVLLNSLIFVFKVFFINTLYVSMKILFLCYFKTDHLGNNSIVMDIIDHIHAIG